MHNIKLNNSVKMPILGMGTYGLYGEECTGTVIKAYDIGFRSFDTASAYKNAKEIGSAFSQLSINREDIYITTKLSNREQEKGDIVGALSSQLFSLGLEYVDLYLIHWPYKEYFINSWTMMEKVCELGLARSIGVCNFHEHHLMALLKVTNIVPAINQIELHPLLNQKKLTKFCKSLGIHVEAYTPLARMNESLVKNAVLCELAQKHNKSVPQIILRWDIQNEIIAIPKASKEKHIKECIEIFDFILTDDDMRRIDNLNLDYRVRYNPDTADMKKL